LLTVKHGLAHEEAPFFLFLTVVGAAEHRYAPASYVAILSPTRFDG
jgi:hypothetical protein